MKPRSRPPPLAPLKALDLNAEVATQLPGLPALISLGTRLHIADESYTGGGNSEIHQGSLDGQPVIIKTTKIHPELYVRLQERERIFNRLTTLSTPVPGILIPILRCFSAFTKIVDGARGLYLEVYPPCIPFHIDTGAGYLQHIKIIIDAVSKLHMHGIAHMDLKYANIMFRTPPPWSHTLIPAIIDFGEARLMEGDSRADLPIVTSLGLIQRSPTMGVLLNASWIEPFAQLLVNLTPPMFYHFIDRIMLGILLSDRTPEDLEIVKPLGKRLICSSISELFKYWRTCGPYVAIAPPSGEPVFRDLSNPDTGSDYTLPRLLNDINDLIYSPYSPYFTG